MSTAPHPTGEPIEIPPEFSNRLADAFDLDEPPETVWEWWLFEGNRMAGDDMDGGDRYTSEETPHEVHLDGRVRYAPCALDGLAAASMERDLTAAVRSRDPTSETTIVVEFSDDGVRVVPENAVLSFTVPSPDELLCLESHGSMIECALEIDDDIYATHVCASQHLFESRDSYEAWDDRANCFGADADKVARLLHRLHRTGRPTLAIAILSRIVMDRLPG